MSKQTKYWFKAKPFGWGWYPATWQGWSIILFYLFLVITNFRHVDSVTNSASDSLLSIVPETFILTILLIIICHATGEKPGWHWGNKNPEQGRRAKKRL